MSPDPAADEPDRYDVVIVGGGTAGCVLAARLSEDPAVSVCVIEGGPSDVGDERVLRLRNWINLLESDLDYGYRTTEQPRGNSHIVHSRARVLGGCSSHNTMISFVPPPEDFVDWERAGAVGWGPATMLPYADRVACAITPVAAADRNPVAEDFLASAHSALGVEVFDDFNAKPFAAGVGFFSVAYDPATGHRSSASVAYLHPLLPPAATRPNLRLILETRVLKVLVDGGRAVGVVTRDAEGTIGTVHAAGEIVLAAGAVDTPRLLLLSGIGPADDLRALGIDVVADVPGVGEHLVDHPESIVVWETAGPLPPNSAMDADAGLFLRRDETDPRPDLMMHFYQVPFCVNTERVGYPVPEHGICMTPNVPRAHSAGRMWLTSADPDVPPALDFRYFDDDGYDERTLVDGIRAARAVAATEPLAGWLVREVAPGPDVTGDAELSAYARSVAHTVYHPAGTARMGTDPLAVVDPDLRVRGVDGLRVADASVFPTMTTVNPVVAVLMLAERAADLIRPGLAETYVAGADVAGAAFEGTDVAGMEAVR